jgi:hypothetical protein
MYFACQVKGTEMNDNGNDVQAKRLYLVQAENYTAAEANTTWLVENGHIDSPREYELGTIVLQKTNEVIGEAFDINANYEVGVTMNSDEGKPIKHYLLINAKKVLDLIPKIATWISETPMATVEVDVIRRTKLLNVFKSDAELGNNN